MRSALTLISLIIFSSIIGQHARAAQAPMQEFLSAVTSGGAFIQVAARKGSKRVGGSGGHGKGSRYVGGRK